MNEKNPKDMSTQELRDELDTLGAKLANAGVDLGLPVEVALDDEKTQPETK